MDDAFDYESDVGVYQAMRDRALLCLLPYSGVRIGESFGISVTRRSGGLRWEDVDLLRVATTHTIDLVYDVAVLAITTNGARRVLELLCKAVEIGVES